MDAEAFLDKIRPLPYLVPGEKYDFKVRYNSFIRIAETICSGFRITATDREIYEQTVKYFAADTSCKFPLDKGLYLYGPIGVGKSVLFKIIFYLNQGTRNPNLFRILTINEVIDGITKEGAAYWTGSGITSERPGYYSPEPRHLLIDDLGQSSRIAVHFGNQIDVAVSLIQRRYNEYTDKYVLTHISTNLEPDEIRSEYGEFIASRIRQMCTPVRFNGKDKRK